MFDIGWQELFIIALVAIVVVGPKELPRVLRTVTLAIRKVRSMASDFQHSIDELARESELQEIRRDLEKSASIDLRDELERTIDPTGEVKRSVAELEAPMAQTGEELQDPMIGSRPSAPESDASAVEPARDAGPSADTSRSGTGG